MQIRGTPGGFSSLGGIYLFLLKPHSGCPPENEIKPSSSDRNFYSPLESLIFKTGVNLSWLDANLCAPLGAILFTTGIHDYENAGIIFEPDVLRIVKKNGFYKKCFEGKRNYPDRAKTTIEYNHFVNRNEAEFVKYILSEFNFELIEGITKRIKRNFVENLIEIFNNSIVHSLSKKGIFTCGQYYPYAGHIDFCVTDLGAGFRRNVAARLGSEMTALEAISWAVDGQNTTKSGKIPGGLGLKILREYLKENHGRLQIISENGYWEQNEFGRVKKLNIRFPFPGSIVNIRMRTKPIQNDDYFNSPVSSF